MGWTLLIVVLGLVFGSFFNVLVHRIPRGESIVFPGSHCPKCSSEISWYDNIPLFSFLCLKGKCRYCQEKIAWRYPIIEIITFLILLSIFKTYGTHLNTIGYSYLFLWLIPISIIDIDTKLILNKLLFPCFFTSIPVVLILKLQTWQNAILGAVGGGLFVWLIGGLGYLLFRKASMGMGDVKLMILLGLYTGFPGVIIAFFFGIFITALWILFAFLFKKIKLGETIPFGPFLALGTYVYIIYGKTIISWYLELL